MKKFLVVITILALPLTLLFAHPASNIKADYKAADKSLAVDVTHMLSTAKNTDGKKHFIKEITVSLNGKQVEKKTFTSQTGDHVTATFKVNAKSKDKISIAAVCSLAGTKTEEIVVK